MLYSGIYGRKRTFRQTILLSSPKIRARCPCQSAREACPQYQWRNPFAELSGTARWKASTRRLSPSRTRSARRSVPTSSSTSSVSSPPTFWRESLSQGHSSVLLLNPLLLLLFKIFVAYLWQIDFHFLSDEIAFGAVIFWLLTFWLILPRQGARAGRFQPEPIVLCESAEGKRS